MRDVERREARSGQRVLQVFHQGVGKARHRKDEVAPGISRFVRLTRA
jgi:hypothetical protein